MGVSDTQICIQKTKMILASKISDSLIASIKLNKHCMKLAGLDGKLAGLLVPNQR